MALFGYICKPGDAATACQGRLCAIFFPMKAVEIGLTHDERVLLQHWTRAAKTEQRRHIGACVTLALAQGLSNEAVARCTCQARTALSVFLQGGCRLSFGMEREHRHPSVRQNE